MISAGTSLHLYRVVEKIGEGGMGAVWKAIDVSLAKFRSGSLDDEFRGTRAWFKGFCTAAALRDRKVASA